MTVGSGGMTLEGGIDFNDIKVIPYIHATYGGINFYIGCTVNSSTRVSTTVNVATSDSGVSYGSFKVSDDMYLVPQFGTNQRSVSTINYTYSSITLNTRSGALNYTFNTTKTSAKCKCIITSNGKTPVDSNNTYLLTDDLTLSVNSGVLQLPTLAVLQTFINNNLSKINAEIQNASINICPIMIEFV